MERFGIDVSKHNGVIDWAKVKNAGIEFAIIRDGYGRETPNQIDSQFYNNYENATAAGMPLGAYHYSYAITPEDAVREANFCIKILGDRQFEYPIYFDIEDKVHVPLSKQECTDITYAFCETLEKAGFWAGIYSFDSFFATHLDEKVQSRFAIACARVENIKPTQCKIYQVWQNSWTARIDGISTETDTDYCYVDYPKMIRAAGRNNLKPSVDAGVEKKYDIVATAFSLEKERAYELKKDLEDMSFNVEVTESK